MAGDKRFSKISEWLLDKPRVAGLFVLLLLLLVISLITNQRYRIIKENEHHEMLSILNVVKQNIDQALRNSYTSALSLSLTINANGIPENFEKISGQLLDSNSNYQALQLVPNGIIKYIYPIKGNEGALGYNIFKGYPANVLRAYAAIESRRMYFIGPDKLWQGGVGVVGRLPIYMNNKFWGFSAIVIKLDNFLKDAGVSTETESRFYFQFSKQNITTNKEEFFLHGPVNFSDHEYETVVFPDGNWKLYLISKNKLDVFYQLLYPMLFGLILALFCSMLVTELLKKPAQLQKMVSVAQKDLLQSFEVVTEQNNRLLNFSYIVSHNLRSHTSNIQAISALIELTESEAERKELIGLMTTVSGTLNETLLNLNKVVNIHTNIDEIKEYLNLRSYIDRTINVLNEQISIKNTTVRNLVPGDINIYFNPAYLESILFNFIFNAIRYCSPTRIPIVDISVNKEDGQIVLKISDNGIGIDLEKYGDQLFGMYKTFTQQPDSKGLGLFISKNQINAMGGKVTVQSKLDEGTCFMISFR
ncbi:ATP-binding protein [Pedobacter sp. PWIIR3]